MRTPVLEIKNLSLSFDGSSRVVNNLSLQIHEGEVHGIIGESGSGKSLTALSVVSLLPPSCKVLSGEMFLHTGQEKVDLFKLRREDLLRIRGKEVGFVFQDPMTSLNPSMRCGKQVAEIMKIHLSLSKQEIKQAVIELFEKVKLPEPERIYQSYPHEISGGQRQRVMIAMAMACKPKLLIADEPTTALDVTVQKRLIQLIDELRKTENLAVLFISHDLNVIAGLADRVSIMYRGEIVESAVADEIFHHPKHPYTQGLLACRPPMDQRVDRLPTVDEFLSNQVRQPQIVKPVENENRRILIEVSGLNVYYGSKNGFMRKGNETHALTDIGFKVFQGESLAILGESGSGKSTLGKTLLNLLEARSGNVEYKGEPILGLAEKHFRVFRKKIQFVFQDPYASLDPKQKIGDAISESLRVHHPELRKSELKNRVIELLEMVGLKAMDMDKYPNAFSGGQRQRVVIARALSVEPECLICDEAVSALDVSVQAQILNLLNELKSKLGLTFLFITHDLGVTRFFCDRVLVMEKGEIVESGTADEVFGSPAHPFTRSLIYG